MKFKVRAIFTKPYAIENYEVDSEFAGDWLIEKAKEIIKVYHVKQAKISVLKNSVIVLQNKKLFVRLFLVILV